MKILIGGGSTQHIYQYFLENPHLQRNAGWFATPNTLYPADRYRNLLNFLGADNGAYTNFDDQRYVDMIERFEREAYPVQWVTLPDVVCDSDTTLKLFETWAPRIQKLPLAFVGQNGAESLELPWSDFDCFFIGGDTNWKLSAAAADLVKEAIHLGKHVHMGRVNSQKRIRYAYQLGCHSIDGSAYSRWWKDRLIPDLNYLYHIEQQIFLDF